MWLIQFLTACSPKADTLVDSVPEVAAVDDTSDTADSGAPEVDGPEPCALEGGRLPLAAEGEFLAREVEVVGQRARCEGAWHAAAGAAGSTIRIELTQWSGDAGADLEVTDLLGVPMASLQGAGEGSALTVPLTRSGEVLIRLDPDDAEADANDYGLQVSCEAGCELLYTRHPIVLMHGMGGTDSFVGLFNYFIDVKDDLTAAGYAVYTPAVDAFSPPEERAAQWVEHLEGLLAEGAGRQFNLVGHSQGGVDARYLTTALGFSPHVASITTLATPHHGSAAADLLGGTLDLTTLGRWVVDGAMSLFTDIFGLGESDFTESILRLSPEEMERFNELVPDAEGVRYFSWTGRTCGVLDFTCQSETNGEIVDLHFIPTHTVIELMEGPNDGLVSVSSAEWGEVRGEMPADHLNQIGFFSDTTPFDHLAFFEAEAAHLADEGL